MEKTAETSASMSGSHTQPAPAWASDPFLATIAAFIDSHRLLSHEGLHLVALSGGADSVCLLLVLRRLGYRVEAVHCNFHLRGDESRRDEEFVEALCRREGIVLHRVHFDTRLYAAQHHEGIETAARHLRYSYFCRLRDDIGAETVCVAHHRDDSAETVLMNIIRGTGLRGLTGIKPRQGYVVRPLLCVSRADIEAWLGRHGETFVTDSTNLVADVVRNKIRLEVIPALLRCNAGAVDNILSTAQRLREATAIYDSAIKDTLARLICDGGTSCSIEALLNEPSPECILFEWLTPAGFTPAAIESIARRLEEGGGAGFVARPGGADEDGCIPGGGKRWCSSTHELCVAGGSLLLTPFEEPLPALRIPEEGTYVYGERRIKIAIAACATVSRDAQVATLDADSVAFPLTLRPVARGDRFRPFGMNGTRLVSDFLTDLKVPLPERRRQLVVCDASGSIVWLVGRRTANQCRITDATQRTLTISY